ncbi:dCTP deaminase domain-containing protein [Methylocystis heyeri]|uniref:Deoxycytidine triphosphate deaminase n=1 Tax=Methylocystis heyeri TaxID=391905 RepID=A0A6B8KBV7_9HYPH|nr:deoxycytidine triphosphate deaminase [Methylocystis heyeri]QGM45189.1 deoxycytidine triphosphate deaminase [Methylocystis heyeri]
MSFWSGEKLAANPAVVSDFSIDQVDVNAYNLRMGNCYFRTAESAAGKEQKKTFLSAGEAFIIPPGQFAYLLSREAVNVPDNAMAFISMRTGVKFKGLINVSGFHVDPGYEGKLIYAVYNAGPSQVQICEGDAVFKIWFCDLDHRSGEQYLFRGSARNDISSDLISGMSKEIYSLQSLADKMRDLEASINTKLAEQKPIIDNLTFVWRAVIVGVIGAVLLAVLTLAWQNSVGDFHVRNQRTQSVQ